MPARSSAAERGRFREVFGAWTTGVAVITGHGEAGPAGMTANAVSSLSLDPLLVLACFDHGARTLVTVRENRRFGINVLRAGQEDVAATFASKAAHGECFAAAGWSLLGEVPVLDGVLAWLACDLDDLVDAGDHAIAIGAVRAMGHDPDGAPLVWHRGRYVEVS